MTRIPPRAPSPYLHEEKAGHNWDLLYSRKLKKVQDQEQAQEMSRSREVETVVDGGMME